MIATKRNTFITEIRRADRNKQMAKIRREVILMNHHSSSTDYLYEIMMKKRPLWELWNIIQNDELQLQFFARQVIKLGIEKLIGIFGVEFLPFINLMASLNDQQILMEMGQANVCEYIVDCVWKQFQYRDHIKEIISLSRIGRYMRRPLDYGKWQRIYDGMLFCDWNTQVMELYGIMIDHRVCMKWNNEDVTAFFTELFHRVEYIPQSHHYLVMMKCSLMPQDIPKIQQILGKESQQNMLKLTNTIIYKYSWFLYKDLMCFSHIFVNFLINNKNQVTLRNLCLKIFHNTLLNEGSCWQCCQQIIKGIGEKNMMMLVFDHELVQFPFLIKTLLSGLCDNQFLLRIAWILIKSKRPMPLKIRQILLSRILVDQSERADQATLYQQYQVLRMMGESTQAYTDEEEQVNENIYVSSEDDLD